MLFFASTQWRRVESILVCHIGRVNFSFWWNFRSNWLSILKLGSKISQARCVIFQSRDIWTPFNVPETMSTWLSFAPSFENFDSSTLRLNYVLRSDWLLIKKLDSKTSPAHCVIFFVYFCRHRFQRFGNVILYAPILNFVSIEPQ